MARVTHARVIQARVNLVLDQPFFGALALLLEPRPDPGAKAGMWTDGRALGYDPERAAKLSMPELQGLICQHVMRCALGHPWRRSGRDQKRWNTASEQVANTLIREAGMALPEDADPTDVPGLAVEQVYAAMPEPPPCGGQDQGDGRGSAGGSDGEQGGEGNGEDDADVDAPGCGEVRDADAGDPAQEQEWQVATFAAAQAAKAQGKLPASLDRLVAEMRRPKVDWRAALRRFVQMTARQDYSWRMPNRRYLASGLYLPDLRSETMPPLVVAVDTSGSIGQAELDAFAAELASVMDECQPERLVVIYCDALVHRVDEYERGEAITLSPRGGGGTDFHPVFARIADDGLDPACLIYLTDTHGTFPDCEPEYPVLWVSTERDRVAPWGETLYLEVGS